MRSGWSGGLLPKERVVKKYILALALTIVMGFGAASAQAQVNPVDQLTGKVWMESSPEIKKAVLFGVDCAVTIEHFVAAKTREVQKDATKSVRKTSAASTLSPFEKGWATAFEGMTRDQIEAEVDARYKAHRDQLQRPVFSVLWYDVITPKLQKK